MNDGEPPVAMMRRAAAAAAIGAARRITAPKGIERYGHIGIDGTRQWLSIRGRNRANPVMLVIHGGPGTPFSPISWAVQGPWEDFFTVVNWDQRGVGKSADQPQLEEMRRTLGFERLLADADAVVRHLCASLGKERVCILGHSWGSMLGVSLAARSPQRISVLASVGQAVSPAFEPYIRDAVLERAARRGDEAAVRELRALDLGPRQDGRVPIADMIALRRHVRRHDGMWFGHPTLEVMDDLAALSPDYTDDEVARFRGGASWLADTPLVVSDLARCDLRAVDRLPVPVVLLQGRHDLATPYEVARRWFDALDAPDKACVVFEDSAHFPMFEEPGRFVSALAEKVLPHAIRRQGGPVQPQSDEA